MARSSVAGPKPRNDAYTGLLAISFLALVGATVLMFLDQDQLGKPPAKGELKVDVPGTSIGKAGDALNKGVAAPAPAPEGGAAPKGPMSSRAEPGKLPALPPLPGNDPTVTPTSATEPGDSNAPPLPIKRFDPPK